MKTSQNSRLEQLLEFQKADPGDLFTGYAIALEYLKLGETQKSLDILHTIKNDNPDYLPVYYQLGKLHESKNEFEKALEIYAKGTEIALAQKNMKTLNELRGAMEGLGKE